jgi:hypothetical protein
MRKLMWLIIDIYNMFFFFLDVWIVRCLSIIVERESTKIF